VPLDDDAFAHYNGLVSRGHALRYQLHTARKTLELAGARVDALEKEIATLEETLREIAARVRADVAKSDS